MKFEIKHRYSGTVLFSLETSSIKLCVEGAVNGGANLSGAYLGGAYLSGANLSDANLSDANLSGANLRGAYLSGAYLSGANLSDANLSGANLRGANLSGANLRGANLRDAYLRGAYLRDAKGIEANKTTPLRILLEQPGPIWAYKLVNAAGEGPFNGGINYCGDTDDFTAPNFDANEAEQCGAGINLATLDWVMREWLPGYRILIMEFFANEPANNLCVPTCTDGKFRVRNCRRVGEKDLKELGLIKE